MSDDDLQEKINTTGKALLDAIRKRTENADPAELEALSHAFVGVLGVVK